MKLALALALLATPALAADPRYDDCREPRLTASGDVAYWYYRDGDCSTAGSGDDDARSAAAVRTERTEPTRPIAAPTPPDDECEPVKGPRRDKARDKRDKPHSDKAKKTRGERDTSKPRRDKTQPGRDKKGNASANNGKGGNYDRTGHEDNGRGNGRMRK